jgi:hypothetical protein
MCIKSPAILAECSLGDYQQRIRRKSSNTVSKDLTDRVNSALGAK